MQEEYHSGLGCILQVESRGFVNLRWIEYGHEGPGGVEAASSVLLLGRPVDVFIWSY